jgi:hypothetical protein
MLKEASKSHINLSVILSGVEVRKPMLGREWVVGSGWSDGVCGRSSGIGW